MPAIKIEANSQEHKMNQIKLDMRPNAQSHDSVSSWQSLSDVYTKGEQMREVCLSLIHISEPTRR